MRPLLVVLATLSLSACTRSVSGDVLVVSSVGQPPEVISQLPSTTIDLAVDDQHVWALTHSFVAAVWRAPKTGGLAQPFSAAVPVAPPGQQYELDHLAVDDTSVFVNLGIVPAFEGGLLLKAPKTGGNDFAVLTALDGPGVLAVDDAAVYEGEATSDVRGGGALEALDKSTGATLHVYIQGSHQVSPPTPSTQVPDLLAQDDSSLYSWVSAFGQAPNALWRFAKDGSSAARLIANDEAAPAGARGGLDVDDERVWTGSSNGLWSMVKTGGPLQNWSDFGPVIRRLVGDDRYVYVIFADDIDEENTPARGVARIDKASGNYDVISYDDHPKELASDGNFLYWTRENGDLVRWQIE